MVKHKWIIEKQKAKKPVTKGTIWLFGLHAVKDALVNPAREKKQLVVTRNAAAKLADAIAESGIYPQICDLRKFAAPLDPGSVHQGAALEVKMLKWGNLEDHSTSSDEVAPRLILLDQVSDPQNVGAILRSAEVFRANAVIGTHRHSAPETGSLAKSASGSLERQPYLRLRNLAKTISELQAMGYIVLGLDGTAQESINHAMVGNFEKPIALVLGAEGAGLRQLTKKTVDKLVRINSSGEFGSLNVSNAAAVALYASRNRS